MYSGYYLTAFDMTEAAFGTLTLATAGESDVVIDLTTVTGTDSESNTSSLFFHYVGAGGTGWCSSEDPTGDDRLLQFATASLALRLQTLIRAAATTATWADPTQIFVSWRKQDTIPAYRFEYLGHTMTLAWSAALGRALMGFAANVAVAAETSTGTIVPLFCIVPTLPKASGDLIDYEPEGIGNHYTPDDGSDGFGTSREVSPLYRDWVQQFETKEKTMRLSASLAHLMTYQGLFEQCRGHLPFMVVWYRTATHGAEVFALRSDGLQWHPERASSGNDAQFHIQFKTQVIGTVATS